MLEVPMKRKIIAAYLKDLSKRTMAFSLLKYLFLVIEIFRFLHYANKESNDIIGGSTKTVQILIRNTSRNISLKPCSSNLAPKNVHHKRKKMTPVGPLPFVLF